ncbi:hypothetical protein PRIPAC_72398 [Pristionchus pacificus]|uniref:Uncharacterized protein n=1 Tax=Pristionchus pacificus TaxID=54126 RepID=A0A2A6BGN6_PRIPA|nr:hypothetical protein PRIPAC_72398 [Pristionchus pacificus]|eukprot:PDM64981.1 hypothetical protein PRIPAC_53237 [Pristionchus pacificus]
MVAPLFCRVQRIGDAARQENDNSIEWAPPLRVIAVVTLFASTLDLMADFLLCSRYVFEMIDVCLTLKYEVENVFYARLAKSLVLAAEEVPLPSLLYILFTNEPRLSLAQPVFISSWIKLVALTWGIVKFTKLRFCWPCLPLNPKHDFRENLRRMVSLTLYRVCMIIVNSCHILAIVIVIKNLIASSAGGRPIVVKE